MSRWLRELVPGRCSCNLKLVIFKFIARIFIFDMIWKLTILSISCEISSRWIRPVTVFPNGFRATSAKLYGTDKHQMLITLTNPTSDIGILHLTKTCWRDFGNTATTRSRWGLKKIMVLPHPRHNTSVYRIHRQFSTAKMRLKRGTQRFSNMVQSSVAVNYRYRRYKSI